MQAAADLIDAYEMNASSGYRGMSAIFPGPCACGATLSAIPRSPFRNASRIDRKVEVAIVAGRRGEAPGRARSDAGRRGEYVGA